MTEDAQGKRQSGSAGEARDEGQFTLDGFRKMLDQLKHMDQLQQTVSGTGAMRKLMETPVAESEVRRLSGIIDSMTPEERHSPAGLIDQTRCSRIAAGAGAEPRDVSQLVKQVEGMAGLMRQLRQMSWRKRP